jgi:hypothetical protein
MDNPHAQRVDEFPTDLDLEILDLLREDAQSAELLAETLSEGGEQVEVDAVCGSLEGLASYGLVCPSGESPHHADEADADEPHVGEEAEQRWEITEEGRAVIELQSGVARAPYDRDLSAHEEDAERDVAGLMVLLLIALVTGVCAAYTLLTATGVLGGG